MDDNGECICDTHEITIESVESPSTRSLARSERKRQRAFLKKHTTIAIDSNKKRRKRKHRKRQLNFAADSLKKLNTRLRSEISSNRRIKREILHEHSNLTNIDGNFKVINFITLYVQLCKIIIPIDMTYVLINQIVFQDVNGIHEISGQSEVTKVLKEIAEEEIDEVDIIMEDITDEIKDLQQSITSNFEGKEKDIKSYGNTNVTKKDELSQSFGKKIKV